MNVLVIAPHPDDETLGCGGTLLKHHEQGDEIYWLIMTTATVGGVYTDDVVRQYEVQRDAVSSAYGFAGVCQFDFPTAQLDRISRAEIISRCTEVLRDVSPGIVFLPGAHDAHSDHRITFECAWSALKQFRSPSVKKIYMYETLSETEYAPPFPTIYAPTSFCDVSKTLEEKIAIAKIYATEFKAHPFPRSETSIRSLSALRGGAAGVSAAEAFALLREYW